MKSLFLFLCALLVVGCSHSQVAWDSSNSDPTFSTSDEQFNDRFVLDEVDSISPAQAEMLAKDLYDRFGVVLTPASSVDQTHILTGYLSNGSADQVIGYLSQNSLVEHVEPLYMYYAQDWTPNDPDYPKQWSFPDIGMPTAWGYTAGYGITVAVIDTGVSCQAPDLAGTTCVPGYDFVSKREDATDDHGHGTHVAGTIAQTTNNGIGVAGVAFGAKIMPIKVLAARGGGTVVDIADGIRWAADHGAQVINMSLGGGGRSSIMEDACTYAHSKGVVVVAAAGNDKGRVNYPGAYDHVVGVSAYQEGGKYAEFTSRGPEVDVAGPGVNILQQTICRDKPKDRNCFQYEAFNGTSMATPHVAAVAALVMSEGVTDPDKVESIIKASARTTDQTQANPNLYGAGYLNADGAVKSATFMNGLFRMGLIVAAFLILRRQYQKARAGFGLSARSGNPMLITALVAGAGLFFLPMVVHVPHLYTFMASHPLAELDLAFFPQFHQYLPMALPVLPLLLVAVTWQRPLTRELNAGLALGMAAYTVVTMATGMVGYGVLTLVSAVLSVGVNGLVVWMSTMWRHAR